jgi:hypothetical protein
MVRIFCVALTEDEWMWVQQQASLFQHALNNKRKGSSFLDFVRQSLA